MRSESKYGLSKTIHKCSTCIRQKDNLGGFGGDNLSRQTFDFKPKNYVCHHNTHSHGRSCRLCQEHDVHYSKRNTKAYRMELKVIMEEINE